VQFSAELREAAAPVWDAQLNHPFVRGIGDGSLPEDRFRFYVRQDYLFLIDYGRLLALAAARAPRLEWMRRFASLAESVLETEMDLHRQFAARWGITAEQLESERTAPATDAYCDFLLRTASLGDFAELVAALLPCMWSYAEIGSHLAAAGLPEIERGPRPTRHSVSSDVPSGTPGRYAEWVEMYASDEFEQLAAWCRDLTDAAAAEVAGPARRRMHAAFRASSEHELAFWDSAWRG
jgi:thiaminase/transcriptional activator TenA